MIYIKTNVYERILFVSLVLFFCLASTLAFAQTFTDVPPDYWAYPCIEAAYKAGLTQGTTATTFTPEQQVTRAQMAVFLARALKLPTYTGGQIFTDVPTTYPAFKEIGAIYLAGITQGCTATQYCPEGIVTRAQMAVFLARATKLDTSIYDPNNSSTWAVTFTDVPTTYPAWKEIQAVYAAKITLGSTLTTYSPENPVTRAQMAVFLCRAFDIQVFDSAKLTPSVTSSSEYLSYYDHNTLDNNLSTYWQGKSLSSPWWLNYDLGSIYNLSYITIYWNKDRGASNYDLQISNDNLSWTTVYSALSTPSSTTNPVKVTLELTGKTGRYVRIYIKTAKSSYPIIYETYIYGYKINDATLPTVTITSPINNAYVSKTTPIQVNATDNVGVLKTEFYIDNNLVLTDPKAPYEYSWDTSKYSDGAHAIKSVALDTSYNRREASITAKVDNTAPTGTIKINNDNQYTISTSTTLTLSATDSGSGMGTGAQMQFSNDNTTWSTAEAYATPKAWTLASGDGTKTVYVKYKDAAGNWSSAYSDTIILDTTTAPNQPRGLSAIPGNAQVNLSWTANTESDLAGYNIYRSLDGTTYNKINTSLVATTSYQDTGLTNGTTYYYKITAVDKVGNESVYSDVVSAIPQGSLPYITSITPTDGSIFLAGAKINIQVNASGPDINPLQYQISIGGTVKQAWSSSNIYAWQTTTSDIGSVSITCEVRDSNGATTSETISYSIINPTVQEILQKVVDNYAKIYDFKTDMILSSTLNGQPFGTTEYCRYYFKAPNKEKTESFTDSTRATKTEVIIINGSTMYLIDTVNKITQQVDLLTEAGISSAQFSQMDIYYNLTNFLNNHTVIRNYSNTDFNNIIVCIDAIPKAQNNLYSKLELYIDYNKGLLIKSLLYKDYNLLQTIEVVEVQQMPNGAWSPKKMNKTPVLTSGNLIETATYSNLQINVGLTDSDFDPSK